MEEWTPSPALTLLKRDDFILKTVKLGRTRAASVSFYTLEKSVWGGSYYSYSDRKSVV